MTHVSKDHSFLPAAGVLLLLAAWGFAGPTQASPVKMVRVPNGGLQPQAAVDGAGTLHLIYLKGEPAKADVYYVTSRDYGKTFSAPLRVNSEPGSAVAGGTIRGAQLALGGGGRVHVAWNGSSVAKPRGPLNPEQPADSPYNGTPMLYTRLNDAGTAFEPERNLMQHTFALDGGGSVAADESGNVYVGWHGNTIGGPAGEAGRRVWVARSNDSGKTFSPESAFSSERTGACGCCGLRLFAGRDKQLYALFRSATNEVHRDIYLVASNGSGESREKLVHRWNINACPMSSMAFAGTDQGVLGAWETEEQVYFSRLDSATVQPSEAVAAPGSAPRRKHPSLAVNERGETLLVWTEGTGWNKGGSLAWQLFDPSGKPLSESGRVEGGVGAWSFGAAVAAPGGFVVLY
jgi:hypothetical protein